MVLVWIFEICFARQPPLVQMHHNMFLECIVNLKLLYKILIRKELLAEWNHVIIAHNID